MPEEQAVDQTAQQASQEAAQSAAKMIAQAVAQAVEQFTQKLGVTTATTQRDSTVTARDVAEETLGGEAIQSGMVSQTRGWDLNAKRLFDEMLGESLESIRRTRLHFDRIMSNAITADAVRTTHEAENGNFASKGLLATNKLADDRMWNLNEETRAIVNSEEFQQGVAAIFTKVIADMAAKQAAAQPPAAAA